MKNRKKSGLLTIGARWASALLAVFGLLRETRTEADESLDDGVKILRKLGRIEESRAADLRDGTSCYGTHKGISP